MSKSEFADALCSRCGKPYSTLSRSDWGLPTVSGYCGSCNLIRKASVDNAAESARDSVAFRIGYVICPNPHCSDGWIKGGGEKKRCSTCGGKGNITDQVVREETSQSNMLQNLYELTGERDKSYLGSFSQEMQEKIKRKLPSNYDKEGCFISTACLEAEGLSDNCLELKILRKFRDDFVLKTEKGEREIEEYYRIAPIIVSKINSNENSQEIYKTLFGSMIESALNFIERGEFPRAYKHYKDSVLRLKEIFVTD